MKRKLTSLILSIIVTAQWLLPPVYVQAQTLSMPAVLPVPGTMVSLSDVFTPPMIRGLSVDSANPLQFQFIVDGGDHSLEGKALKDESSKLVRYFLAALTIPEDKLWVNLGPGEEDRIIPEAFAQTEMGRDLLGQDYLLKQLTASLMYPEKEVGHKFWQKVYAKAQGLLGQTDIPTDVFHKVWIVPEKASVYQEGTSAFVVDHHLKVMLEKDYNELIEKETQEDGKFTEEMVRDVLLPEIEREVNEGAHFANLRQIYHAVILAKWYKQNLKQGLLQNQYVDQNKTQGIDLSDHSYKEDIYHQYMEALEKGAFNYIREEYDSGEDMILPKKYFSGGATLQTDLAMTADYDQLAQALRNRPIHEVVVNLDVTSQEDQAQISQQHFAQEILEAQKILQKRPWEVDPHIRLLNALYRLGYINNFQTSFAEAIREIFDLPSQLANLHILNNNLRVLKVFTPENSAFITDALIEFERMGQTMLYENNYYPLRENFLESISMLHESQGGNRLLTVKPYRRNWGYSHPISRNNNHGATFVSFLSDPEWVDIYNRELSVRPERFSGRHVISSRPWKSSFLDRPHLEYELQVMSRIEELDKNRQDQSDPINVLFWDVDDGLAIDEVVEYLESKRIKNVNVIGFSDKGHRWWSKLSSKSTIIVGLPEDLGKIIREAEEFSPEMKFDIIASYDGLNQFRRYYPGRYYNHLDQLHDFLKPHGVIVAQGAARLWTLKEFDDIDTKFDFQVLIAPTSQKPYHTLTPKKQLSLSLDPAMVGEKDVKFEDFLPLYGQWDKMGKLDWPLKGVEDLTDIFTVDQLSQNLKVLDLGTRAGAFPRHFATDHSFRVLGIDKLEGNIKEAREVSKEGEVNLIPSTAPQDLLDELENQEQGAVAFAQMDIGQPLDLPDESFDVITVYRTLTMLVSQKERENFFKEAFRVLKPGGHLHYMDMRLAKNKYFNERYEFGREILDKINERVLPEEFARIFYEYPDTEVVPFVTDRHGKYEAGVYESKSVDAVVEFIQKGEAGVPFISIRQRTEDIIEQFEEAGFTAISQRDLTVSINKDALPNPHVSIVFQKPAEPETDSAILSSLFRRKEVRKEKHQTQPKAPSFKRDWTGDQYTVRKTRSGGEVVSFLTDDQWSKRKIGWHYLEPDNETGKFGLKLQPRRGDGSSHKSSMSSYNLHMDFERHVWGLINQRENSDQAIHILDWGAGPGIALSEFQRKLNIQGIKNVFLYGYSHTIYEEFDSLPPGITMFVGLPEDIPRFFQIYQEQNKDKFPEPIQLDLAFAQGAFEYFFEYYPKYRFTRHLKDLRKLFKDQGFFHIYLTSSDFLFEYTTRKMRSAVPRGIKDYPSYVEFDWGKVPYYTLQFFKPVSYFKNDKIRIRQNEKGGEIVSFLTDEGWEKFKYSMIRDFIYRRDVTVEPSFESQGNLLSMKSRQYKYLDTPLHGLNQTMELERYVWKMIEQRPSSDVPLHILDWGAGSAMALKQLRKKLDKQQIKNIYLYGYSDTDYNLSSLPNGVTMFVGAAEDLPYLVEEYQKEMSDKLSQPIRFNLIFSHFGIVHLYFQSKERFFKHLNVLESLMHPDGFFLEHNAVMGWSDFAQDLESTTTMNITKQNASTFYYDHKYFVLKHGKPDRAQLSEPYSRDWADEEMLTRYNPSGAEMISFLTDKEWNRTKTEGQQVEPSLIDGRYDIETIFSWSIVDTPLSELNRKMDLERNVWDLINQRKDENQAIHILDWGAGHGVALSELREKVDQEGVQNVYLYGFSDRNYQEFDKLPAGITMFVGIAEDLPKFFQLYQQENAEKFSEPIKLDAAFSHYGITHLYSFVPERFSSHLTELSKLFKDQGAFYIYESSMIDLINAMKKEGVIPEGIHHYSSASPNDEREGFYYTLQFLKDSSDAAMASKKKPQEMTDSTRHPENINRETLRSSFELGHKALRAKQRALSDPFNRNWKDETMTIRTSQKGGDIVSFLTEAEWQKTPNQKDIISIEPITKKGKYQLVERYRWSHRMTPLDELNDKMHLEKYLWELIEDRKNAEEPIHFLDWGAGQATALIDIKRKLDEQGIKNVFLYGYSDRKYPSYEILPEGITMFVGVAEDLPKLTELYQKEKADILTEPIRFDAVFSHFGITHLYKNFSARFYRHLQELQQMLQPAAPVYVYHLPANTNQETIFNFDVMPSIDFNFHKIKSPGRLNNHHYYVLTQKGDETDAAMADDDEHFLSEKSLYAANLAKGYWHENYKAAAFYLAELTKEGRFSEIPRIMKIMIHRFWNPATKHQKLYSFFKELNRRGIISQRDLSIVMNYLTDDIESKVEFLEAFSYIHDREPGKPLLNQPISFVRDWTNEEIRIRKNKNGASIASFLPDEMWGQVKLKQLSLHPETAYGKYQFENIPWSYEKTSLKTLNDRMDLENRIWKLIDQRDDEREVIRILSWGAGRGEALKEIKEKLDEQGVRNVELYGYSNKYYKAYEDLPEGITIFVGVAEDLEKLFNDYLGQSEVAKDEEKVNLMFSHFGITHLYIGSWAHRARFYRHLEDIKRMLHPEGSFLAFGKSYFLMERGSPQIALNYKIYDTPNDDDVYFELKQKESKEESDAAMLSKYPEEELIPGLKKYVTSQLEKGISGRRALVKAFFEEELELINYREGGASISNFVQDVLIHVAPEYYFQIAAWLEGPYASEETWKYGGAIWQTKKYLRGFQILSEHRTDDNEKVRSILYATAILRNVAMYGTQQDFLKESVAQRQQNYQSRLLLLDQLLKEKYPKKFAKYIATPWYNELMHAISLSAGGFQLREFRTEEERIIAEFIEFISDSRIQVLNIPNIKFTEVIKQKSKKREKLPPIEYREALTRIFLTDAELEEATNQLYDYARENLFPKAKERGIEISEEEAKIEIKRFARWGVQQYGGLDQSRRDIKSLFQKALVPEEGRLLNIGEMHDHPLWLKAIKSRLEKGKTVPNDVEDFVQRVAREIKKNFGQSVPMNKVLFDTREGLNYQEASYGHIIYRLAKPILGISYVSLYHEFVHQLSKSPFPTWLDEALTEYLTGPYFESLGEKVLEEKRDSANDYLGYRKLAGHIASVYGWEPLVLTYLTGDKEFMTSAFGKNGDLVYQLILATGEYWHIRNLLMRIILFNAHNRSVLIRISKVLEKHGKKYVKGEYKNIKKGRKIRKEKDVFYESVKKDLEGFVPAKLQTIPEKDYFIFGRRILNKLRKLARDENNPTLQKYAKSLLAKSHEKKAEADKDFGIPNPDLHQQLIVPEEDDQAQVSEAPGGIDLNPDLIQLDLNEGAQGVDFPIFNNPAFENITIEGLRPVIIQIRPIQSLPLLLGRLRERAELARLN